MKKAGFIMAQALLILLYIFFRHTEVFLYLMGIPLDIISKSAFCILSYYAAAYFLGFTTKGRTDSFGRSLVETIAVFLGANAAASLIIVLGITSGALTAPLIAYSILELALWWGAVVILAKLNQRYQIPRRFDYRVLLTGIACMASILLNTYLGEISSAIFENSFHSVLGFYSLISGGPTLLNVVGILSSIVELLPFPFMLFACCRQLEDSDDIDAE